MDSNFLPNVKCPHCGASTVAAISGFGSELSVRGGKGCKKCGKPFDIVVLSMAVPEGEIPYEGTVNRMKNRIGMLKKMRQENIYVLSMKLKEARAFLAEADEDARKMAEARAAGSQVN